MKLLVIDTQIKKPETSEPRASPKSDYYNPSESLHAPFSVSCPSAATKRTSEYKSEVDTQDEIELLKYTPIARKNITPTDIKSIACRLTIHDTSKAMTKNPNLLLPRNGFPHERVQRKEAPAPLVQNIISDIPSTLNRMSMIGNVTNIEKLIANRLKEFYTTNRII